MENDFSINFKAMKDKYQGNIPDNVKKEWLSKPPSYELNGDGLEDIFIGEASNQPGALLVQQKNGKFKAVSNGPWISNASSVDMNSVFFDADGDGDQDIYVVSGGNEFQAEDSKLQDRLYLNDGKGGFEKSKMHCQIFIQVVQ